MKLSKQFPLNALRVFEAAARHMSFTRAGEELGMTQTAVSYQIKLLEENIGEPLFLRSPRQIALTQTGERLLPKVSEGFGLLAEAVTDARQSGNEVLEIHSAPTFASQWLARHLGSFQLQHPQIAVRLVRGGKMTDFARDGADISIRWGNGPWPGVTCIPLIPVDFSPMLSPQLAESIGGIGHPADLLRLPIIGSSDPWWKIWFAEAGIDDPDLETHRVNDFGEQDLDASAALSGQGVAILTPLLYRDELASGRLIQPFSLRARDGKGQWLIYPENRRNVPKIRAFRQWILKELESEGARIEDGG
ncbi:MAG: LysR family transcriptional regulator [Rhizobium sp.]|nr:LysR family transcriptional regulator [Rhizobium sp.]